ncbi:MAG: MerR family transcriptional regulator [Clostridiaceae bacterium]|nr:MerR family transcriptional regulator [Clostridiaceae bacterium]
MKEKNSFYIGELSDLFNISVDSIRYYEKIDLIHPHRNEQNGYREYSLDDIQTLVIIRELLNLGFHSEQIREFVMQRTVDNTVKLLEEELNTINEAILSLYEKKNTIQSRLRAIRSALSEKEYEKIELREYPKRPCVMIAEDNLPDDYVDYYTVKFMKQSRHQINIIGFCDCYTLDLEGSNPASAFYRTKNVFFLADMLSNESNYFLPAGKYLCITYRGSLVKTKQLLPKLFSYAKKHNLSINGDPIEMCHIDSYETSVTDEFYIELELPVR